MTSGDFEIGAAAVALSMHASDLPLEAPPLLPRGCACVQRPTQRLVTLPPDDDEAAIER